MATEPNGPEDKQPPASPPDPAPGVVRPDSLSENLLSQSADDVEGDPTFSVAEEVNLDQQSGSVRRVGQAPEGDTGRATGTSAPDAMAEALSQRKSPD